MNVATRAAAIRRHMQHTCPSGQGMLPDSNSPRNFCKCDNPQPDQVGVGPEYDCASCGGVLDD